MSWHLFVALEVLLNESSLTAQMGSARSSEGDRVLLRVIADAFFFIIKVQAK